MILNDLWINSEIYLGQFSMIHGDWQKTLKFTWGDCWWFWIIYWWFVKTEIYLGWFLMIFDDFQWFIKFWNLFGTILGDAWWLAKSSDIYLYWISVILDDSWWFTKKLWNLFGVIFCYFEVFICDSCKTLKFI